MAMAIREAQKALGQTSPNPPVGCVIVSPDGQVLSTGYHKAAGQAHAEIEALNKVDNLQGATLFVTLEPCAHQGRTPSCAQTLAQTSLANIVYGLSDPNPLVSGRGCKILTQAGKNVVQHPHPHTELTELVEVFFCNMHEHKAFVALKMATSLDGQMALSDGTSKWITSPTARKHAHVLRKLYDAVLVGANTISFDNPQLNARPSEFEHKASSDNTNKLDATNKLKHKTSTNTSTLKCKAPTDNTDLTALKSLVILDPDLSLLYDVEDDQPSQVIPIQASFEMTADEAIQNLKTYNFFQHFQGPRLKIVIDTRLYAPLQQQGLVKALEDYVTLVECPFLDRAALHTPSAPGVTGLDVDIPAPYSVFDLCMLREILFSQGVSSVLVEGGASTHQHFVEQKQAQRVYQFIAPMVLGGASGPLWTHNLKAASFQRALKLHSLRSQQLGPDILLTGVFDK